MRSDRERLLDILEAIDKIMQHPSANIDDFAEDEREQVWVVYHLQIIGEAASRLSGVFRAEHAEIPLEQMIGMRHVLVHGYFQVDLDVVWSVLEKDLPPLRQAISTMLNERS